MSAYASLRATASAAVYAEARTQVLHDDGASFRWPRLETFNWALEWFDVWAQGRDDLALIADGIDGIGHELSFDDLRTRSDGTACWLLDSGVRRGERVIVQLPQVVELWETMVALMKVGAHIVPIYPGAGLEDRQRTAAVADAAWLVAAGDDAVLPEARCLDIASDGFRSRQLDATFVPDRATRADEPMMSYLSSGTTGEPKLITHTHTSYPVGHLSSLAWQGIDRADRHLNLSEPGWAKHSWSSLFVPWTAGATVVAPPLSLDPEVVVDHLMQHRVTSLCGPVRVWESMAGLLPRVRGLLRSAQTAGEPLDPDLALRVRRAAGIDLRPGYGQTETTAITGVRLGEVVQPGCVGSPLPGYDIHIVDDEGHPASVGRVCLVAGPDFRPISPTRKGSWFVGGRHLYPTGDIGTFEGRQLRILGRNDDVFKRDGHRVSPAAIESVLRRHPKVADVGVSGIPGPHGREPHAFIRLAAGVGAEELGDLDEWARSRLSPLERPTRYSTVGELPRTASGKLRRFLLPRASSTPLPLSR